MKDILLISPNKVKALTIASDNTDDKYLLSSIREAQDTEFQQVVGQPLYEKLKELVSNDEINVDENIKYKELLDKSEYFLSYATLVRLVLNTTYKLSNIGLNTTTDENVQIPTVNDTLRLRDEFIHTKDYYKMQLQNYLLEEYHKGNFKELLKCQCHKLHSNLYSSATSGLNLGLARGKGINYKCGH